MAQELATGRSNRIENQTALTWNISHLFLRYLPKTTKQRYPPAKAGLKGVHRQDCRRHASHHLPLYPAPIE